MAEIRVQQQNQTTLVQGDATIKTEQINFAILTSQNIAEATNALQASFATLVNATVDQPLKTQQLSYAVLVDNLPVTAVNRKKRSIQFQPW